MRSKYDYILKNTASRSDSKTIAQEACAPPHTPPHTPHPPPTPTHTHPPPHHTHTTTTTTTPPPTPTPTHPPTPPPHTPPHPHPHTTHHTPHTTHHTHPHPHTPRLLIGKSSTIKKNPCFPHSIYGFSIMYPKTAVSRNLLTRIPALFKSTDRLPSEGRCTPRAACY